MLDLTLKPIYFIIGGQEVKTWPESDAPLSAARDLALMQSGNVGRPPDEWEIREMSGVLVDPERDGTAYLGQWLFVTVKVGAGGGAWHPESDRWTVHIARYMANPRLFG